MLLLCLWWMLALARAVNNISDVGAQAIAEALPACNLQKFWLSGTCRTRAAQRAAYAALLEHARA